MGIHLRTGHLFAGIDGIGLGLDATGAFETVWFSEYDDAPSKVLAHHYPDIPNHGDITAIDWNDVEPVDVLTGGFPCQDISKAGRGAGIKEGTRSGLWFEYVRAIRDLRPRIVIVENVSALLGNGMGIVLGDLAEAGFDASWTCLRASDVGAPHRRERIFIVAHAADRDRLRPVHRQAPFIAAEAGIDALRDAPTGRHTPPADGSSSERGVPQQQTVGAPAGRTSELRERSGQAATDPDGTSGRQPRGASQEVHEPGTVERSGRRSDVAWGEFEPAIRRWERVLGRPAPVPAHGKQLSAEFTEWHMGFPTGWVTDVLDRNQALKALGNAVVPQCAELVGRWALDIVSDLEAAA